MLEILYFKTIIDYYTARKVSKYGPEKISYLDTFHVVLVVWL